MSDAGIDQELAAMLKSMHGAPPALSPGAKSFALVPEEAPFSPAQKAWLNGFLSAMFGPEAGTGGVAHAAPARAVIKPKLLILYGSQTGTSESLAKKAGKMAKSKGYPLELVCLDDCTPEKLAASTHAMILTSTYGEGEPPDNARAFAERMIDAAHPKLEQLKYTVLALGDTNYRDFCKMGRDVDHWMASHGAQRFLDRVDCDLDYDQLAAEWMEKAFARLEQLTVAELPPAPIPHAAVSLNTTDQEEEDEDMATQESTSKYSRSNPFPSPVLVNSLLTGAASEKETRHVELSLVGSELTYVPGDAVGIVATNRPAVVNELLAVLGFTGEEPVKDHAGVEISLHNALTSRLAIGKLGRGSLNSYAKLAGNAELNTLALPENKAKVEEYLWGREFIDLVAEYPRGVKQPQELFAVLPKLTPRMYSIASSQAMHTQAVHTTVRVVRYESLGVSRQGLASGHLGERSPVGSSIPVFLHTNNNFRLPQDPTTPVIMVGPGTGVAPFRAFLQHRMVRAESGDMWLFFGEQREATDFLYKEELMGMMSDGVLTRLDVAFSRDQAQKLYVQTRMREQAKDLYRWLEQGAYFYVCGDASRMAKDVESALLDVIATQSAAGPEHAAEYLATMKKQKRYQRDVY